MSTAQDNRRFMAAVGMSIANLGNPDIMWEFVAQFIASLLIVGDPSAEELASIYEAITGKVAGLLDESGAIWPEFVPGPVMNEEGWDVLLHEVETLMAGGTMTVKVDSTTFDNIKLDYGVGLHRVVGGELETLYAGSATFFLDEHGIQWVKFWPSNGYERGKEIMWRTDQDGFAVSKR